MESQARRVWIVAAVVVLALAAAWLATRRDAPPASAARVDAAAAPTLASPPRPTPLDPHDHAAESPDVAPDPNLTAQFFDAPVLADAAHFAVTETRLLRGPGCEAHPVFARDASAEARMGQLYALATRERFPQDTFYRNLTQFWREGARHYQLSATWDIGLPPTYTVRLHESADPAFAGDVRERPLPLPAPSVRDAVATSEYFARVVDARAQAGAQIGLRILDVEWPGADGGRIRATFADGRPVSWTFPGGRCVRAGNAHDALQCRCLAKPPKPANGLDATS